jgi:hypothetical protein
MGRFEKEATLVLDVLDQVAAERSSTSTPR